MANIKSAEKRAEQSKIRALRNRIVKTKVKNRRKKVIAAVAGTSTDDVTATLSELYTFADRAAKKGVLHKNTVARIKSRHALAANKKQAQATVAA